MANICFDCQRALPLRGCSWADNFQPVEGWTATPVTIKTNISHRDSYNITACPLFLQDKPKPKKQIYKKEEIPDYDYAEKNT